MTTPAPSGAAAAPQPDGSAVPAVPAVPAAPAVLPASEPFEPAGVEWTGVSPSLATARLVVATCWLVPLLLALVVIGALTGQLGVWIGAVALLALTGWILWLIPRQVRAMGYAERADDLLLRRGILFRSMVVVPYGRMQYVDVNAGPLARKLGIASVQLHTASPGTDASIDGLPTAEAARLRDQLASRGEARLAGL